MKSCKSLDIRLFHFSLIDFNQTVSGPIKNSDEQSGQSVICSSFWPSRKCMYGTELSISFGSLSRLVLDLCLFPFVLSSTLQFIDGSVKSYNTLIIVSTTSWKHLSGLLREYVT